MKEMKFLKGMCAGMLLGACVGMFAIPDKKPNKRQVSKAVRAMGQTIEDFSDAIKF